MSAMFGGSRMSKCVLAAVTAVGLCVTTSVFAQDPSAATAGGDVTADEATPLPPVVVQAPAEPIRSRRTAKRQTPASSGGGSLALPDDSEGAGTTGYEGPAVGAFTLGQLDLIGGATITNEAMWTFNKQSLDKAVSIMPGVSMHNAGGSRNERDIFVRGFDRLRVPLYMDGVRIYLPYDNRLDFNRFLTPDLAEIQVQKGYVSVLNGPGGMGGAINLVSRKPTKEVELEGRSGLVMNGDLDDMNQWNSYAYAGTRQKGFYAQISGTIVDQDHFNLSDDFSPAGPGVNGFRPDFPYEDGGNRDRSDFRDWRINAKIGITPNATDEYSVNYTTQAGEKGAPLHTDRQIVQGYMGGVPNPTPPPATINAQRYWDWPEWDLSTLSWLSKTQIGSASYMKTNAYYNTFDNILAFYPNAEFEHQYDDSVYGDHSYGGFVEMGTELIPMNTLKASIHYRRDVHREHDIFYDANGNRTGVEPITEQSEESWSFAGENTFHATKNVDIVTGLSYDTNEVLKADGSLEPLPSLEKWNWQAAAIFSYSRDGKIHADVSSRTRFPTLFDRYSTRFGNRSEEPGLDAERATNYEIGISDTLFNSLRVSSAVFYSDIEDSIQSAFAGANGAGSIVVYNGNGESYGFELSADWDATRTLRIGGNYTFLERDLDFRAASLAYEPNPGTSVADEARARQGIAFSQLEGTPEHELFFYVAWKATDKLTLTPSLEVASDRKVLVTSCKSTLASPGNAQTSGQCTPPASPNGPSRKPNYVDIGSYALLNFSAEYAFNDNATLNIGVNNLLDENYSLSEGFPEAGRQFFASARMRF